MKLSCTLKLPRLYYSGLIAAAGIWSQWVAADGPATAPTDPFIVVDGPPAESARIGSGELIRFELVDGLLTPRTTIQPTAGRRLYVEGVDDPIQVTVVSRGESQGLYTPHAMNLRQQRSMGTYTLSISLYSVGAHFNMACDVVSGEREQTIQFVQAPNVFDEAGRVRLHLQDLETGARRSYPARDFSAFIRQYPDLTARYLRPIIEGFSPQPHLFTVNESVGWRVFPEAFAVSESDRRQVHQWVKQLDSDDARRRQEASDALQQMGNRAAGVLQQMPPDELTAEQAIRIESLLAQVNPDFEMDPAALRGDPSFLIDCLMSDVRPLRIAALGQLKTVAGRDVQFPIDADRQERIEVAYSLRRRLLPEANLPATRPMAQELPQHIEDQDEAPQ